MTTPRYTGTATDFYVAAPEVADIVNLAIDLHRPILVEGEPGCGKTMLAASIAAELGLGKVVKIAVKSTTRAQDLLVRMNALRRLQDAQRGTVRDAQYVFPYLSLGLLGEVFRAGERRVVLIDEVDKADIDFPNDLLDVLDEFSFQVDELPPEEEDKCRERHGFGRSVGANPDALPVVVITSNREKRLPEPFLRRCLYVRVNFPQDPKTLREIVRKNTQGKLDELSDTLLNAMVVAFLRMRDLARSANAQKPPTTSELIDWVRILHWRGVAAEQLGADAGMPPFWQTLFKTMADLDAVQALAASKAKAG
jgi:MoxR-like ATPase